MLILYSNKNLHFFKYLITKSNNRLYNIFKIYQSSYTSFSKRFKALEKKKGQHICTKPIASYIILDNPI